MGHSYGSATIVKAYHLLKDHEDCKKIEKMVMLDPWLFPLSEEVMNQRIDPQSIVIANEHFV